MFFSIVNFNTAKSTQRSHIGCDTCEFMWKVYSNSHYYVLSVDISRILSRRVLQSESSTSYNNSFLSAFFMWNYK